MSSPLLSNDVERDCTKPADEVIVESLNGIIFWSNWGDVRKNPVDDLNCVVADDVLLLQRNPQFLLELYNKYANKPLTQRVIWNLKNEVAEFYRLKNQPFVVISIPRQELTKCTLQVVVEESRLGQVYSSGNCHFSTRWLAEEMSTNPGDPIDTRTVYQDIAWLNLNPFRRTDAVFKPGVKPGTTDIELVTVDRWPYRVYAGADNTGTVATDRNRLFFGFNFGKSFLKDGQISYQFSFAPNWNLFYAHTASARLPLPWRHVALFWGGYTQVKPSTGIPNMKNRGESWQVDGRYRFPIFMNPDIMQTVVVGYDFKETNNNILYDGVKIFKANADINQFTIGYEFGYRTKTLKITWNTEAFANPGGITFANKSRFYRQLRTGAQAQYAYIKTFHALAKNTKYGWWSYDITAQASSANLLPSEQITMTGYNAVRGFEERVLNLDNGLILNLTYETPHISFLKETRYCKIDEFYLVAFLDAGVGGNHKLNPGEDAVQSLGSIGPGARYQIDRYLTARFDYGVQLWHKGFHNPTGSRYNFGLIMSY